MAHGNNGRKTRPEPDARFLLTHTKAGKRYTYLGWVKAYHDAERHSHQYGEHQRFRWLIEDYPDHFKQYAGKHQMSESTNTSHYKVLPKYARGATQEEYAEFERQVNAINRKARTPVKKPKPTTKQERDNAARLRYEHMTPAARRKFDDKMRIRMAEKRVKDDKRAVKTAHAKAARAQERYVAVHAAYSEGKATAGQERAAFLQRNRAQQAEREIEKTMFKRHGNGFFFRQA